MFRTVRDLALGLRPSMLDDLGLEAAWNGSFATSQGDIPSRSTFESKRMSTRCRTSTGHVYTVWSRKR
jgi:signal transduction histidine kinase